MMKVLFRGCFFAACFALVTSAAIAQQRVHASAGTVTAIHPKIGMIEMDMNDGSSGHFKWLKPSDGSIDFDKSVSADATAADKFTTIGVHAIVYFVGQGDVRTAVALRPLGDGTLKSSTGTVVKVSRKEHLLTIKNSSGAEESFRLDPKTVADTETGVAEGFKFDFAKGNPVHVTAAPTDGIAAALLIAPAM